MNEDLENTVDLGADDAANEPGINLEEKYLDQMRQIVIQKIELPVTTLPTMIKEQITLNPEFQRRGRWDVERRSRFIESIIMNVPIPQYFWERMSTANTWSWMVVSD